jgi:hypothetical protein
MAITITALTSSYDNVDRSVYTTASVSPTASRWLVVDTFFRAADIPTNDPPAIAGLSLTWVPELSANEQSIVQVSRAYAWTGGTPGSGTITITPSVAAIGAGWIVYEIGGANLSDPFLQTIASPGLQSGLSQSVTLAAFGNSLNRPLISSFHNAAQVSDPDTTPTAYTEIGDISGSTPLVGFAVAWNSTDADTTPSYSWATTSNLIRAIASEIADAGGGGGSVVLDPFGMSGFFGG